MTTLLKHYKKVLFAALLLVLIPLTLGSSQKWGDFTLQEIGGIAVPAQMPYMAIGHGLADYTLKGDLELSWFSSRTYRVVPDDILQRLTVNGQPVDLSFVPANKLRDVEGGFNINLEQYLTTGHNKVEVELRDLGGNFGIIMESSLGDWRISVLFVAWSILLLWIFLFLLDRAKVSKIRGVLYFLISAGAVIQVWYVFAYNPVHHIWSDPGRHWEHGIDVLRLDLMSMTDPIGYQVFVAIMAKLTLKIPALVAFYTSVLALLGPWLWYLFLRQLQSNKNLALAGWAFLSLLPSWTVIYAYFMQETLMLPLLGASLWATWRCRRKADVASFCLMVGFWAVVGLTRGISIPMAAVVCTWLWINQDFRIKKAVYSLLILGFILGPLVYRSYHAVHHFAPHGMGHLNVIYSQSGKKVIEVQSEREGARWGNGFGSPSTGEKPFEPFSDWMTQRTGKVSFGVDLDEGKRDWDKAKDEVNMPLSDYLWITKENLIFLFFSRSWPDNNKARLLDRINAKTRFIWAPICIILIVAMVYHRRKLKGQWMLPSVIIAWFIVQGLFPISVNEGRYRKPLEGLLAAQVILLLAAISGFTRPAAPSVPWVELAQRFIDERKRKILPKENHCE